MSQNRLPRWTPVDVVVTCKHMPIQHTPTTFATAPSSNADDQKMYKYYQTYSQNAVQLAFQCDSLYVQLTVARPHLANILRVTCYANHGSPSSYMGRSIADKNAITNSCTK